MIRNYENSCISKSLIGMKLIMQIVMTFLWTNLTNLKKVKERSFSPKECIPLKLSYISSLK